jgi:protein-disulfide isomerase
MTFSWSRAFQYVLILFLSLAIVFPQGLFAQDHVVTSANLQKDLQSSAATRQQELAQIDHFFSSKEGQKALQIAHIDYQQVTKAVSSLNNGDLARIAAHTERAQNEFAAGSLSNRDLIWIVVGIAALILIIVAVR